MKPIKKTLILYCFLLISNCLLFTDVYAGWPINKTPAFEGRITDATTGEPIENVVVELRWEYIDIIGGPGGVGGGVSKAKHFVTDKNGEWKTGSIITFHMFSIFERLSLIASHPLYSTFETTIYNWDDREKSWICSGNYKDGKATYNFKLVNNHNFHPEYFIKARKAKIDLTFLNNIVDKYSEEINERHKKEINAIISLSEEDFNRKVVFYHRQWEIWDNR